MLNKYIEIKEEVKKALEENKAVVSLESTIISHGMPYPQNVETARKVEEIVRENGSIPATIAILDGKIKVGLTDEELEYLGKAKNV
ncbi:MAG: pseudouridine-5'-phosphate glycosidase, partial [Senegalia sp. (in: firmicutes)]